MSEGDPHKITAFEDPDSADAPLLGVINGTIRDTPLTSEEWRDIAGTEAGAEARGSFLINTYSGAMLLMGKGGYWKGNFSDLPEILKESDGWVSHE